MEAASVDGSLVASNPSILKDIIYIEEVKFQ
jgi:hypothetical protein